MSQPATADEPLDAQSLKESHPDYTGQIQHTDIQPAEDADTVAVEDVLRPELADELPHDLYTHQADALEQLEAGENVCVATSTSSGKTLVYALQIARNHLDNPDSTAMLIYPTKALSRDQEQALNNLYDDLGVDINVQVYDGDTRSDRRKRIRQTADVVITNFSGVNTYLHDHTRWKSFYENLSLLAIDESHSYTGVQGMHVAWTIRRLRRVLDHYDADPQFTLTSATIGNPQEHSQALTGKDVKVIDNDGSPHGKREIIFWDPPADVEHDDEGNETVKSKKPADQEASELLTHLGFEDVQTLMFAKSRKQTELGAKRAQQAARDYPARGDIDIEAYHAGHGKKTRRGTENRLKDGKIDGIISTNALELGIDIGSVDATLVTGYPGTRQSFYQQIGRAGRGQSDALSVFVPSYNSIDQYILDNPDYLLGDNIEDAVVDMENNPVYAKHVLCASDELPLTHEDTKWFGTDRLRNAVVMWKDAGMMVGTLDGGVQYNGAPHPQMNISMYATTDEQFEVRCLNDDIDMEPIDKERAYRDFHEGAVYLHKGEQFIVESFNETAHQPYVELKQADVDYYTQTLSDTSISNLEMMEQRDIANGLKLCWGKGTVNVEYYAYQEIDLKSGEQKGPRRPTGLEPLEMRTQLMWIEFPDGLESAVLDEHEVPQGESPDKTSLGALHAVEHGMIGMAPLELRMDKQDLGGLSQLKHPELDNRPAVFIYDGVPGGLGFSRGIYDNFETIASNTRSLIDNCHCSGVDGCPACVMDEQCGSGNDPLHTEAATDVLAMILSQL